MSQITRHAIFLTKSSYVLLRHKIGKSIPFLVIIVPTKNCNLKCNYCEYYQNKKNVDKQVMSFAFMKKLIDQISRIGVPLLSFSGGEPLLSNDIEKILEYTYKKHIMINLNTNGTLLTKKRAYYIAKYCDYVRLSLNGHEKTHDKITGYEGAFKKTLRAIQYLKSVQNRNCKIGINILYREGEEKRVEDIIRLLLNNVDFFSILPRFSFTQNKESGFEHVNKEMLRIVYKYKQYINNKEFILNANRTVKYKYCDYGKLYLTIYPTGTVVGCPFITSDRYQKYFLGNVKMKSLHNIISKAQIKRPPCEGCYATCTTDISKVFNWSIPKIITEFTKMRKT